MRDEPSAEVREIVREILRYLEGHPDAGDTVDGIAQWWLERPRVRSDVTQAVSLLASNGLIRETRREGLPSYYRLNPAQRGRIAKLARDWELAQGQISGWQDL